ncbi:arylesterase [Sphingopyxis panaciterrulae]|uniref:Acyl-CoA thioesterase-1 n=1 Tax=Sphingopyxis panaciterrulae TaxID=462372 RepID=A0A7W9B5G0_9SPHN|nr:arylesterase [Sphingopyxis panaciterrulae]MBB5706601.1 acyl-CoA thioesterase-1 [Sphingopyxis panaciterrulae]
MKTAGWRSAWIYGCVLALCQPLAACGDAAAPAAKQATKAQASAVPADAPLVIAFGDSLYAGYRLGPKEGLAPQLQAALAADGVAARVQNAGVSGDTTAAGRQRLAFVLDHAASKPALVLLGLGGNDMLRGIDAAETRANLDAMLAELKRRDIPVLLTGMVAAPNLGADYAKAFDPIYSELATQYGASLYPFILDNVVTDPSLMLDDHIHPNAKGVGVIVQGLAPLVEEALPEGE